MTKKLYYKDPYKREFDAVITGVEPGKEGTVRITLDATCFYPKGGGQPADTGTINGAPVVDVRKDGEEVIHILDVDPGFLEGGTVHGVVDWDHRYDFMQQHSGQHLISGAFYQIGGVNTVSVHLGEEITTVELDAESVEDEILKQVEKRVNQTICMNLPIGSEWIDEAQLDAGSLRREVKVSGLIRVVSVEETDRVACGGVHVATTGEIGLVKLVGTETIRRHLRTIWKIGDRAYEDYRLKSVVAGALVDLFSSPLEKLTEAAKSTLGRLDIAEKALGNAEERRATDAARSFISSGEGVITHTFDDEDGKFLKSLATTLIAEGAECFCLLNRQAGRLQWFAGVPAGMEELNLKPALDEILPLIEGKGGGKAPLWQGVGGRIESAEEFLLAFRRKTGR